MEKHKLKLSDEARQLDSYLKSYNCCKQRKKTLEKRRQQILLDFRSPLKNINFGGMPKAKGIVGEGSAALPLQLDEIDIRINEVLNFLELNDMGRIVLEYRYIDSLPWWRIEQLEKKSKTFLVYSWRKALYKLLEFPKVKRLVEDYKTVA